MMESHRAAALSYSKLYRMVSNELALRRDQRTNALDFLKHVRQEQDRLETTSPSILPHIITYFNVQFKDRHIEKPEITGDLDPVEVNTKNRKGKDYSPTEADSTPNSQNSVVKIISGITSSFKNTLLSTHRKPLPPLDPRIRTPSLGPTTPLNVPTLTRRASITALDTIEVVPKN